jgi:hypothetical protein
MSKQLQLLLTNDNQLDNDLIFLIDLMASYAQSHAI